MFDSVAPIPRAESQLGDPEENVGVSVHTAPTSLPWGYIKHLLCAGTGPCIADNRLCLRVHGDLLSALH